MNKSLSLNKIAQEQYQLNTSVYSCKEYVWKNIFKVETLKKENSLRKNQTLCKNLQIKYK